MCRQVTRFERSDWLEVTWLALSIIIKLCIVLGCHTHMQSSQSLQGTGVTTHTSVSSMTSISTGVSSNEFSASCSNSTHEVLTTAGSIFGRPSQGNLVANTVYSSQDDPVQPVNLNFPLTSIGNRDCSFNPRWYDKYQWLEYLISSDAIFCYLCCYFAHGSGKAEDTFTSIGYKDWKHFTGKDCALIKIDSFTKHQEAMSNWCTYKANPKHGTLVATTLDNTRKEQIVKNRHYLMAVIEALMYCATQEIALRGHQESLSSHSVNRGNFLELLGLLAKYDPVIHDRLNYGPKNALYTSHSIQNQLLNILVKRARILVRL